MKNFSLSARRARAGFTLIELLVVIAIIGILAALLLAVLPAVTNTAKKTKAKLEAQAIATAIEQYDSAYGRFPVSKPVQAAASANINAANPNGSDFTYGGILFSNAGLPSITWTNNSEVVEILMNLTNYPNGVSPTANDNYAKNPQKTVFLIAKMSGDTVSPGVGNDLVYRDPWGNPYIITMDLNYDEQCGDAFYSQKLVSQVVPTPSPSNPNGQTGYIGLVNTADSAGNGNNFRYHGRVMVWSAGPPVLNGKPVLDSSSPANLGYNKSHVLTWQ